MEGFYECIWFISNMWFIFIYYECVTAIPRFFNFKNQKGLSDWRYAKEEKNIYIACVLSVIALTLMSLELQKVLHHRWFAQVVNLMYTIMLGIYLHIVMNQLREFKRKWSKGLGGKFMLFSEVRKFALSLVAYGTISLINIVLCFCHNS